MAGLAGFKMKSPPLPPKNSGVVISSSLAPHSLYMPEDELFCSSLMAPRDRDEEEEEGEKASTVPSSSSSRVFRLLAGDLAGASTAMRFEKWVALVRKRSGTYRSSGFPHRNPKLDPRTSFGILRFAANSSTPSSPSVGLALHDLQREGESEAGSLIPDQAPETSLWERLGNTAALDIESVNFPWTTLSSLHHTEHTTNSEQTDEEAIRSLEVTVNSGGVVFFALFSSPEAREAAAVIKIAPSRMATQSERLGYEFANILGVYTPQARIIHNSSSEWQKIKDAADQARKVAASASDDAGEITCSELVEALEMSRCILLMNYVHGSPLLESSSAFASREIAEQTASSIGRVLLLDLVIRNEDRLPCRRLGWRGNHANLLFSEKSISAVSKTDRRMNSDHLEERSASYVVAIDSGVPRRPPAAKRAKDQEQYPKLVELLLNSSEYSSNLLYEISCGKLGFPSTEEDASPTNCSSSSEVTTIVNGFRVGFRAALRDLQGIHLFLLSLYQKLDSQIRIFLALINREELGASEQLVNGDLVGDQGEQESQKVNPKTTSPGSRGSFDSASPLSREQWGGKFFKGSSEPRSLRLTMKLRDFNKFIKVDGELSKEIELWNESFRNEVIRFCHDNHFNTGFFEGGDSNFVIDAYELKVRLEHILERTTLISDAANTEKPSSITVSMFIGGALAARSIHTLQYLGISHILCLCSNEVGQSESQYPDHFEYKNFSICDNDDEDINGLFEEAFDFIDGVEQKGGKVLVHCFEGRSRSATVVLAYLMQRKNLKLLDAWNLLKKVHRRAQPNDGFARILVDMDKKIHGEASMQWQHRRPTMKMCPVCGKNAGFSSSSLKLHLQKVHKDISSGSVDSAVAIEIQRILDSLKVSRCGSVSPTISR